jgi:hypothetical protein
MAGQEGCEVRRDADGSHAGAAAAVRDAERLVQVEVADVGADVAGRGEADLGVHVGAVHVHLAAVLVDDRADVLDRRLEHAVGRRIRDHERGEVVGVRGGLGGEVGESMLPLASHATGTTLKPHMTALAGLVPWALVG